MRQEEGEWDQKKAGVERNSRRPFGPLEAHEAQGRMAAEPGDSGKARPHTKSLGRLSDKELKRAWSAALRLVRAVSLMDAYSSRPAVVSMTSRSMKMEKVLTTVVAQCEKALLQFDNALANSYRFDIARELFLPLSQIYQSVLDMKGDRESCLRMLLKLRGIFSPSGFLNDGEDLIVVSQEKGAPGRISQVSWAETLAISHAEIRAAHQRFRDREGRGKTSQGARETAKLMIGKLLGISNKQVGNYLFDKKKAPGGVRLRPSNWTPDPWQLAIEVVVHLGGDALWDRPPDEIKEKLKGIAGIVGRGRFDQSESRLFEDCWNAEPLPRTSKRNAKQGRK